MAVIGRPGAQYSTSIPTAPCGAKAAAAKDRAWDFDDAPAASPALVRNRSSKSRAAALWTARATLAPASAAGMKLKA